MMKTMKKDFTGRLKWCAVRALALVAVLVCSSCDNYIYDDEGDCEPHYYVRFVYDMNMLYVDAFSTQVNSVDLYVFDAETGKYVTHYKESGDALKRDNYKMSLDNLAAGKYKFVAWCGLSDNNQDFSVPANIAQLEDLTCTMARSYDETKQVAYSDRNLNALFHGTLDVDLPKNGEGEYVYTVKLTKDTNNVNLSLQHLAGEFDPERFVITVTDNNGMLAYDNTLADLTPIEYRPWNLRNGSVDMAEASTRAEGDETEGGAQASFLQAEFATSRLMADHDLRINIVDTEKDNAVIFSIPLIKWALMLRSVNYDGMEDQDYLDREDEYNLMVFLAEDTDGWVAMQIVINGWHVMDNGSVEF